MSVSGHKSCTSTCYKCLYWQRAFSSLRLRKKAHAARSPRRWIGIALPQKTDLTCFDLDLNRARRGDAAGDFAVAGGTYGAQSHGACLRPGLARVNSYVFSSLRWKAVFRVDGRGLRINELYLSPPSMTAEPANQTVKPRQTNSFTLAATGTAPQWQKNGAALSATSPSYTTPARTSSDNGARRCLPCTEHGRVRLDLTEVAKKLRRPVLRLLALRRSVVQQIH